MAAAVRSAARSPSAFESARRLEQIACAGELASVDAAFAGLEKAMSGLTDELRDLIQGH